MQRCVIVGGAGIREYQRIRESLRGDDWFVYCDGGLKHQEKLGVRPDLIVGDFDSHEKPETEIETIVLPREPAAGNRQAGQSGDDEQSGRV